MTGKISTTGKNILVAPLDWGLGHATRCIPVVRSLLQRGFRVFLAGEGTQKSLLQTEFPDLPFLPLPGYRVQYGASAVQTAGRLLLQIPQILGAIRHERHWLEQMMKGHRFAAVISDNRYGLHHPDAFSVLMTHQLRIQSPVAAAEPLLQNIHYRFINRFNECWVPDTDQAPGLAGALAHPHRLPAVNTRFVGPLSRFATDSCTEGDSLLLLLSGPEPQRTLFEQVLVSQLEKSPGPITLVRGLPGQTEHLAVPPGVNVYNHLSAAELEGALRRASLVICRSGYSTVMDLAALGKKSILVPTPGQTEQVYLAKHLQQQGFALWCRQKDFDMETALAAAKNFEYRLPHPGGGQLLEDALDALEWKL